MRHGWLVAGLIWLGVLASPAAAAGIDCGKARSTTEKAICASPSLLALDRSIADAYADQQARQPEQRDQARQELVAWLKHRDAVCAGPSAGITQCLTRELTARLAALAPPALVAQAAPAAAPPPVREPSIPSAANPPAPAATLDAASVPATEQQATLLHVTRPGRFAIAAHSSSGAALQLVDMLAGPGETRGVAGSQDGRLDELLDVGAYKLRVFSAKGAAGAVALTVTPFADAAPPRALPPPGEPFAAELRDAQQLAFWLTVPPSGAVRIEAAGRSLADLRLWRDGRDLVALEPQLQPTEPTPSHTVTDLLLAGKVEPGTYLAIAYGGPASRWTDNDASQPFLLRAGAAAALADGWAYGTIGAFGSEAFTLPASAQEIRLDLPAPEAVTLAAGESSAAIARTSREASITLDVPAAKPDVLTLTGRAGQPYKLQALSIPAATRVTKPGTYWVSAVTSGAGGDEVPPSVLLERSEPGGKPPRIVAAAVPVLSPNAAWRGRFNLRGPTTLLFQNAVGGPVAVRSTGVATRSGRPGNQYDLPADYYAIEISPADGAQGLVDLVVGAASQNPAATPALPANPVLPLGVQTVAPGQSLQLLAFDAPGVSVGLSARSVPVALAEGALSVTLAAGATQSIPVQIAHGGTLSVTEGGGGPVPYAMQDGSVVLAAADRPRTVVLAWHRAPAPPADIPAPRPLDSVAGLQAGHPMFFDLAANEQRGFAVTVPDGGLYRVETLGRLRTKGMLSTPFIPGLGSGEANGIGQNMLMQSVLRAGRYRVDVTALQSAGRLGVSASLAPLLDGGTLLPGGSVRATVPAGSGVRFPIVTAGEAERYHLDVAGLGGAWTGRIDDADGWPITRPGPLDGVNLALQPGRSSLLVIPDAVTRQVVARLRPVIKPVEIAGHGPHPLAFDSPAHAVWREPDGRDQPRVPDTWSFSLAGPAEVTITAGDGMVGKLRREGVDASLARIAARYVGTLEAGRYWLDLSSLGRNDRLDYTVSLTSKLLQPGVARRVTLPASVPFAIAEARVVNLTTFGATPVKAVLRGTDGVVARIGPRVDDWNIAASRPLPAGRYTLDIAAATPPGTNPVASNAAPDTGDADDNSDASMDDAAKPDADDQAAQTAATTSAALAHDADNDAPDSSSDDAPAPTVELSLDLPPTLAPMPAPVTLTELPGRGVHVLTLPQPASGTLLVAQARSTAAVVLSLERQDGDEWRIVALDQGVAPVVASPADADPRPWRLQAWTVDGGPQPIQVAAHAVEATPQQPGSVTLAALDDGLAAARIRWPAPGIIALANAPGDLLAGGWPGHALALVEGGTVLPEGAEAWLLARSPATLDASAQALPPGATIGLSLPAGLVATLPAIAPADGHVALWRTESGLGLTGLGAAMGVAAGSTLALANDPVRLRNAAGNDALRLRITRVEAKLSPPRTLDSTLHVVLAPGTALPMILPAGDKQIQLDLAPGLAAIAAWRTPGGSVVWTGGTPVSRTLAGSWTEMLLVNTGAAPASASLSWQPARAAAALQAGSIVKRFFGADGSFETTAAPTTGARLVTAGNATLTVITADGRVVRGRDLKLTGPARVVVDYTMGAMAVWEAADGQSPWPAAVVQSAQVPSQLTLAGPAMALTLQQDTPVLLHARTTAPVLIGLADATPELFPAGAEFHRMLAAGPAELRLYSPHDGPLSGALELSADPVMPIAEGLGAEVSVAPGGTALFGFRLSKPATIGVGVRAVPDRVAVSLLDASGKVLGEGVAQLRALAAGQYIIQAQVPPDGTPTMLRPAIVGITPRGNGPPPDIVQSYLTLVGMKPPAQGNAP